MQDAATNRIELTYDGNGNVTVAKRFDWNQVTSAYDQLVFEHTYDALDRRTATTRRDPGNTLSSSTAAEYDGRGLLTKSIDELGNTIRHQWDARGLLTKTLRDLRAGGTGAGAITSTITNTFQYDLGGRLLSLSDGLNNPTTYEYDARSRVKKVTNAAGQFATYTFDLNGNVATATDPNGSVVTNSYDVMDRLVSQSVAPGTGVLGDTLLGIAYDALGRPTQISDNDSTILRTYDSLSRLASETQGPNPIGSVGKTFTYSYSAAGFNTSVTYPDTTVEQRNRDVIGRLASVAISGGNTLATYQYAGSRVPSLALANNVTRTHTYDALLRRTLVEYKQNTTSQKKFEYVYNLANYRLLEKRHHAGGTGDNYDLDSIYRSVNVKAGVADPVAEYQNPGSQTVTSTTAVTYDAAQSRSQVTVTTGGTPTTTNYTVDALNFYTAVGATVHVRDANGNLKDDGTNLYDYDYRNQLVRIRRKSDLSVVGTYEYDGVCRRIAKSTTAGTTSFYWVGFELTMEYDASGLVSRRQRGAGFNEVVSAYQRDFSDLDQDGSTTDYVPLTPLYDGAYDCIGTFDHTGGLAESYVHTYEGTVTITTAAGAALTSSAVGWQQGYGRMYRDDESGLLYAVHRYYNPKTGRAITDDPLGRWIDQPNTGNGYSWVANRYRNAWDPLGLRTDDSFMYGSTTPSMVINRIADAVNGYESDDVEHDECGGEHDPDTAEGRLDAISQIVGDTVWEVVDDAFANTDPDLNPPGEPKNNAAANSIRNEFGHFVIKFRATWWTSLTDDEKIMAVMHELNHIAYNNVIYKCRKVLRTYHGSTKSRSWYLYQLKVWETLMALVAYDLDNKLAPEDTDWDAVKATQVDAYAGNR